MEFNINDGITSFLALAIAGGGWVFKQMWNKVGQLQEQFNQYKVEVAEEYIKHDRLKEILQPMVEDIKEIKEAVKHEKNQVAG